MTTDHAVSDDTALDDAVPDDMMSYDAVPDDRVVNDAVPRRLPRHRTEGHFQLDS
jgi:hypothetical protein